MKVKIEKLDHFGRGVGHIDGKVCFIENALVGEEVKIKMVKNTKRYCLGEVAEYLTTSSNRVKCKCPYYNICGGCNLAHLDYSNENLYKQEKVKEILDRFTHSLIPVRKIEYGEPFNYRNKVVLHGNGKSLGYYQNGSNNLIKIDKCLLLDRKINEVINNLGRVASSSIIDEAVVRISNDSSKIMLGIKGKVNSCDVSKLGCYDVLMLNGKVLSNNDRIISSIGSMKYYLSLDSFFQVNKDLTEKLYNEVLKIVKDIKPKNVLDLYCGTGTIGIYVSPFCESIVGVDYSKSNISDALKNGELNNVKNIKFICSKVEDVIDSFSSDIDFIIVDPPRAGMDDKTILNIKKINPTNIVYASCDPVTLARDIKKLEDKYKALYVKPFNMFPRTYHVECVAVLKLK